MAAINTKQTWLAVASEDEAGTPISQSNLRVLDADATAPAVELSKELRANATNDYGLPGAPTTAGSTATIEITTPLYAAQAVRTLPNNENSRPPLDALLRACGLDYTTGDEPNIAIYSTSTGQAQGDEAATPCTIQWNAGTRKTVLTGCLGTFKIDIEAGSDLMLVFSMTGRIATLHTATNTTKPAKMPQAYRRIRSTGGQIEIHKVTATGITGANVPIASSVNMVAFDVGNAVVRSPDVVATDGKSLPFITATSPTASVNMLSSPLPEPEQDKFYGLLESSELVGLSLQLNSPDADVSTTFALKAASVTQGEQSDGDGLQTQNFNFEGVDTTGAAPPVTITFTTPTV